MRLHWKIFRGGTPENGVTAQEATAAETIPFEGTTITKGGNYEIQAGPYNGNIKIDTTQPVNIAIKGNVTFNGPDPFINVANAGKYSSDRDTLRVECKSAVFHADFLLLRLSRFSNSTGSAASS